MGNNPAIGKSIQTGGYATNYHDYGSGDPVLLIHGSGPGVSSWANWQKVFPLLSKSRRVLGIDMRGFGYTERDDSHVYNMDLWTQQAIDFLDAMGLDKVDLVGNSFGGALALSLAVNHPERVRKLVLMGSMGVSFEITYGLDRVWGYTPSVENMQELIGLFAYTQTLAQDRDLAALRYEGSIQPGFQEAFSAMFPEPRQQMVEEMARYQDKIKDIEKPTLIVHGREDKVIPIETSLKLFDLILDSQLHMFGKCGHWTQIEHTERFVGLVDDFLAE